MSGNVPSENQPEGEPVAMTEIEAREIAGAVLDGVYAKGYLRTLDAVAAMLRRADARPPETASPPEPVATAWMAEWFDGNVDVTVIRAEMERWTVKVAEDECAITALYAAPPAGLPGEQAAAVLAVVERVQWKGSFTAGDREAHEIDIRGCVFEGDGCDGNDSDGHDDGCALRSALATLRGEA